MTTADLLDTLQAQGVTVTVEGDDLMIDGPDAAVDAALPTVIEHKADIIAALDPPAWFDDPDWKAKAEYFECRDALAAWFAVPRIKAALDELRTLRLLNGDIVGGQPVDHTGADFNRARALAKPGGREFVARHPNGIRPKGAVHVWLLDLYMSEPTTDAGRRRKERMTIEAVTALRSALDRDDAADDAA
jgi:hypothetical protein